MMGIREILGGFSGFKGRLLLFAGIVVLSGMAWTGGRQMAAGRTPAQWGTPGASHHSGGFSGRSLGGGPILAKADQWSSGAVSLGLTFMLAMVAASVLRAAFKTGVMLLLVAAAAAWFLEYQGYTQVWDRYLESVQSGGSWLNANFGAFGALLQDHLASSGVGAAGFGLGLRR